MQILTHRACTTQELIRELQEIDWLPKHPNVYLEELRKQRKVRVVQDKYVSYLCE